MIVAALALYAERGYDETTVAEIAERAGLTKRTFFRYFIDKREVLFWGSERLQQQMVAAIMHVAYEQWVDDPGKTPFRQIARDALAQLREIAPAG